MESKKNLEGIPELLSLKIQLKKRTQETSKLSKELLRGIEIDEEITIEIGKTKELHTYITDKLKTEGVFEKFTKRSKYRKYIELDY